MSDPLEYASVLFCGGPSSEACPPEPPTGPVEPCDTQPGVIMCAWGFEALPAPAEKKGLTRR